MHKISTSISFLLLSIPFLSTSGSGGKVRTKVICADDCPDEAVILADNFRAVGNKADQGFDGWQESKANIGATRFVSNILAKKETAWPRISEGSSHPMVGSNKTPGYPIRVTEFTKSTSKQRFITFNAQWGSCNAGPKPYPAPQGKRQHGVYLWFNDGKDASKWEPYPKPKWVFSLEVNVWNRVDGTGYREGATRFEDYQGNDGRYEVRGHDVCHKGDCFYAYYVTLVAPKRRRNKVKINLNTLVKHLRDRTWNGKKPPALKWYYELVETSIATEVKAPADGKFTAVIESMGR